MNKRLLALTGLLLFLPIIKCVSIFPPEKNTWKVDSTIVANILRTNNVQGKRVEDVVDHNRTYVYSLALSGCGITVIPPEIAQLASLKYLDLSQNVLESLPPEITTLELYTNIGGLFDPIREYHLDVSKNRLCDINSSVANWLDEYDSNWREYQSIPVTPVDSLAVVDILVTNGIEKVFEYITRVGCDGRIHFLSFFRFYEPTAKSVRTIPNTIGTLTGLTCLFLDYNELSSFPDTFWTLRALDTLTLSSNLMTAWPPGLCSLESLERLSLSNNQIASIPKEIGKMKALRDLFLSGNQIDSLPVEIGQLSNLRILSLEDNRLRNLPHSILQLDSLQRIYVNGNQLCDIDPDIASMLDEKSPYSWRNAQTCQ